jgi:hypothetical protein
MAQKGEQPAPEAWIGHEVVIGVGTASARVTGEPIGRTCVGWGSLRDRPGVVYDVQERRDGARAKLRAGVPL